MKVRQTGLKTKLYGSQPSTSLWGGISGPLANWKKTKIGLNREPDHLWEKATDCGLGVKMTGSRERANHTNVGEKPKNAENPPIEDSPRKTRECCEFFGFYGKKK